MANCETIILDHSLIIYTTPSIQEFYNAQIYLSLSRDNIPHNMDGSVLQLKKKITTPILNHNITSIICHSSGKQLWNLERLQLWKIQSYSSTLIRPKTKTGYSPMLNEERKFDTHGIKTINSGSPSLLSKWPCSNRDKAQ